MNEKEMIKAWAEEEASDILTKEYLPMPDSDKESYWCEYDKGRDILEYSFDTVPELKSMLEQDYKEKFYEDLILPMAVAALKEKKIICVEQEEDKEGTLPIHQEDTISIPDFVYRF